MVGDLKELPIRERFYWLVENKGPEYDMASEFYDAQCNAIFTDPALAVDCLNKLARLNARFNAKFGCSLYRQSSIDDRIEETRRYKRMIINNVDDFKQFISELNEIVNKATEKGEIRHLLVDRV